MNLICIILAPLLLVQSLCVYGENEQNRPEIVLEMGNELLKKGMNAGGVYEEVWIRDLNTFVLPLLDVTREQLIKDSLLTFFNFQGQDGSVVDGYVEKKNATLNYNYISSATRPNLMAHKNTVETDQESSLVQAVCQYIHYTGRNEFLREHVNEKTILERLEMALEYPLEHRFSEEYRLIWGATSADWGDVQPEHKWGVEFDENSHRAIDIYDNALYLIAVQSFLEILPGNQRGLEQKWISIAHEFYDAIREHLWDEEAQKFIANLYLDGSPFPPEFDESKVYNHGGTAVAIQAGLLSPDEILASYGQMKANMRLAGASTLGLTLYPAYPNGSFLNPDMGEYSYQNGGDWTWFGARMVTALAQYGFIEEAKRELEPMLDRVIKHNGFYEWWSLDNKPHGSGEFRASAGVLIEAIESIKQFESEAHLK